MASDGKARSNKQMTITFTLPISCQICLGKVRQPVLCPNHHVFCNLCLEIWLKRNNQCPACRVDIGPDNPVKHIIGSQVEEDDSHRKSTPEFRRARFDLLYREYEDELEQLRKESGILRMENNILITQLKDAENRNTVTEDGKKALVKHPSSQTSEGPKLLLLTRNLQEVQKLYQGIKAEMSELKQENCKLKDESVNLTRENENLRLEIAQRSPKKFGRYTVATLEAKIAEQEKEIRQLKKALERSDSYIDELQQQQDRPGGHTWDTETPGGKPRFKINLEPKRSAEEDGSADGGGPRKVLFGKVVHEDTVKPSNKLNVFSTLVAGKSVRKHHVSKTFSKSCEDIAGSDVDSLYLQQHADIRNQSVTSSQSETACKRLHNVEEPVKASSLEAVQSQSHPRETSSRIIPDKTSRKVHFQDSGKSGDTSSFDLELPSPVSSLISESCSSVSKDLSSPGQKSSSESGLSPGYDCQVKMEVLPLEGEDEYGRSFLEKNLTTSGGFKAPQTVRKTNITLRKKLKASTLAKKVKQEVVQEKSADNSHLSVPDMTSADQIDNLSHGTDYTENSDDLDMSMTPEMTDCLRLIDQAEKKISSLSSISSVIAPRSDSVIVPVYPIPQSYVPPDSCTFQGPSPLLGSFPTTNIGSGQRFAPAGSSSWEQQFYNSLKVNPNRFSNVYRPPTVSTGLNHNPLSSDHVVSAGTNTIYSFMDSNPTTDAATGKYFKFSEPIKVTTSTLDLQDNAVARKLSSLASPFSLYLSDPGSSVSTSTLPSSSSSFNFTAPSGFHKDSYSSSFSLFGPSTLSYSNSYITQNGRHTGS